MAGCAAETVTFHSSKSQKSIILIQVDIKTSHMSYSYDCISINDLP